MGYHALLRLTGFLQPGVIGLLIVSSALFPDAGYAAGGPATEKDLKTTVKTLEDTVKRLTKTRDGLAAKLAARVTADAAKGPNQEMILRFLEGADGDETHFTLRRRGGAWVTGYAAVPSWRQQGFNQLFNYVHRGRSKCVIRDTIRYPADANALSYDGSALTGSMTAVFKLDKTRVERLPPGAPTWWRTGQKYTTIERLGALNHHRKRTQTYTLDVKAVKGVHEFDLSMDKAIRGERALEVCFQVPAQPWVRAGAWAHHFNCGYHGIDASHLTVKDGVLEGPLLVAINPDKWFPKRPHYITYHLTAKLDGPLCVGEFKAEGDMGEYTGTLRGGTGQFVAGTFESSGDLGSVRSMVFGRVMPVREDAAALMSAGTKAEGASPETVRALATRAAEIYREIRALCMAVDQYPLPIETAMDQTRAPAPEWGTEGALTPAQLDAVTAFANDTDALVSDCVAGLGKKRSVVMGAPDCGDLTFGPFAESVPLASSATNVFALPEGITETGPQRWAHIPSWSVLGPLHQHDDMDHNLAGLPEVVPAAGAAYEVNKGKLTYPKGVERPKERVTRSWESMAAVRGKIEPPWSWWKPRGNSLRCNWFARAALSSDKDREVWVSLAADAHAKLWVNGKLTWIADEILWRNRRGRESIFKITLRKGENDILLRAREDRGPTWLRFHVCVRGAPDPDSKPVLVSKAPRKQVVGARGDGSGRFVQAADPPLVWELEKGTNVAWQAALPATAISGAAATAEKIFVCCGSNLVVCLDAKTGKLHWKQTIEGAVAMRRADGLIKTDGATVWANMGGQTAAYTMDGKELWRAPIGGAPRGWTIIDGVVVIEHAVEGNRTEHACHALDAMTGKPLWNKTLPGAAGNRPLHALRLQNGNKKVSAVVLADLTVLEPASGRLLCGPPDTDARPKSAVHMADDMVVYGLRSKVCAHRYMLDPHGQVVVRPLWRIHYGLKTDSSVSLLVAGRYVLVMATPQEDRPGHSPAAATEVYAYDRATGRPIRRLKPVLKCMPALPTPAYVAPYVFVHSRGGYAGGIPSGQIGVVRIDGLPERIRVNIYEARTRPPSFAGSRMFLVGNEKVWCVGVTDEDGQRYQDEQVAEKLFEELWAIPRDERFTAPRPLATAPEYGTVPICSLESGIGLPHWMRAGPFPLPNAANAGEENDRLAALRAKPGDTLSLGGVERKFEALPQRAVAVGYNYGGGYYLQGMGAVTASVFRNIDVLSCTGDRKDMSGVLYTVVANGRPRVATLRVPPKGVEVWMGGIKLKPNQPVQLDPAAYPLVVRLRPDKMGKKVPPLNLTFKDMDDPRAVRRVWLKNTNRREEELKAVARRFAGHPLGEKAEAYLEQLGAYKVELDIARMVRSVNNGGTAIFADARPPVPWERGANLRWRANLPGEAAAAPVASGDLVLASVNPNRVTAVNRLDGSVVWSTEIPGAKVLSAPAATKDAVYVADAGGAIVRLRRDGTIAWTASLKKASGTPTALIAGSMLVVHNGALYGVNMGNGEKVWTVDQDGDGAPAAVTLGGNPALLTCAGTILDPATGGKLVSGLPANASVVGQMGKDMVYAVDEKGTMGAYWVKRHVRAVALWERVVGSVISTPVVCDDRLYALTDKGETLALAAADGRMVTSARLSVQPKPGVSRLLLGGLHLFAVNLGDDGRTIVLKPGAKLGKAWEYSVPGASLPPFFLGDSAFVASGRTLFCMGGEPPAAPGAYTPPTSIEAAAGYTPGDGVPVVPFEDGQMPMKWLFSSPAKPRTIETDFLASAGTREKVRAEPGTKAKYKDQEIVFRTLDAERSIWSHPKFSAGLDALNVRRAVAPDQEPVKHDGSTVYLYTVVENDKPRFVEVRMMTPGAEQWNKQEQIETRLWLNGVPVADHQVVELAAGKCPIMIQVSVGTCKSNGGMIWVAPRFIDRTVKYAAERDAHNTRAKVWAAYESARNSLFVLK